MAGNIVKVTADGRVLTEDSDLDALENFEVETGSGARYRVDRLKETRGRPSDWTVVRADDSTPVGRIHSLRSIFGVPTSYRYTRDGATFSAGKQLNLWNAVQSLTT
jgi:hypothetical protein